MKFRDLEKAFDRVPREVVWWAMRKLGVEEWLVRAVKALYKNPRSCVRVNNKLGENFDVKVGVHQGSVLSPLLFIMILEALSREFRVGLPWELLYADDLVLVAESMEELEERFQGWKNGMESKGLCVNMNKTKIMISGIGEGAVVKSGKWPCGVCGKGVGSNSIMCSQCSCWIHKRCSGIRGRLTAVANFVCASCSVGGNRETVELHRVEFGGDSLECVNEFCYLGDMLSAGGGAESTVALSVE